MKLSLLTIATLASTAICAPQTTALSRALARRDAVNSKRDVAYNVNWAGAVYNTAPSGHFTGVSSTFAVITPSIPTNYETKLKEYTASAWIGIDGSNCNNLWQAGVDSIIEKNGDKTFYAWHEWYPAATEVVDLGVLSGGDIISVNITTSSATKGTVVMENVSTGTKFSKTITSSDALCLGSAEWIMEDVTFDDPTTGLAAFGNVTFSNAIATTSTGTVGPENANLVDIQDEDGEFLTVSSVEGGDVTVKYDARK